MGSAKTITVERNGDLLDISIPDDFFAKIIANRGANFMSIRFPFIAEGFLDGSVAKEAGVEPGDHIIGINDVETWSFDEFREKIGDFKNQDIRLQVVRNDEQISLPMTVPESGLIGVYLKPMDQLFEFGKREYSILAAIPAGTVKAWQTSVNYLRELRLLFHPEVNAHESLGGFITIGSIFAPTWDWVHFWTITAFLSIILAIMNLLPIPALDGGHVMFLFYEIIARRKPSDKFMEYAQTVGMVLLIGLILFAQYNDIMRLFR